MINLTDRMIYRLGGLNNEQSRISYQMSTGKVLERGSDDSKLYARELYIKDKIRVYEGLETQIEKTNAQNTVADSSMGQIKDFLTSFQAEVIKGLNEGMDASDKKAMAVNIEGMRDNVLSLVNERVNGEYIFTGSDTTVRPFEVDSNTGKIVYNGDAILRTIAVDPSTYRERGITGFDAIMYTSQTAISGQAMTFEAGERIIDESGLEWHLTKALPGDRLTFDKNDTITDGANNWSFIDHNSDGITDYDRLYLNGNPANEYIETEHVRGDQYRTKVIDDLNIIGGTVPASLSVDLGGLTQLRQVDINGKLSGEAPLTINTITAAVGVTPETYTINDIGGINRKFEAKHNFFNDIEKIITALNTDNDDDYIDADPALSITGLRSTLDMIDKAFNYANIGHSVLGARNKIFEIAAESVESKITHYNILYQEVAGADLSKVAMEAKSLEMQYTALYSTISKMHDLTLVNFVR